MRFEMPDWLVFLSHHQICERSADIYSNSQYFLPSIQGIGFQVLKYHDLLSFGRSMAL